MTTRIDRQVFLNIFTLVGRKIPPNPWEEGEKIPWNDPDFSARMLREHLSQDHDAASRRTEIIDEHVNWLHNEIMEGKASRILDLGCGPGLYTSRLASMGHSCVGIDYGPASIAYARGQVKEAELDCKYIEGDIREAEFGAGYGLVMMVHGELNVFRPEEIKEILRKVRAALADEGKLVIEVHTLEAVQQLGEQGPNWYTTEKGLFSDEPYLMLEEAFWDANLLIATERTYVINANNGNVIRHVASIQGYDNNGYMALLENCGFSKTKKYPSLGRVKDKNYEVYVAWAG